MASRLFCVKSIVATKNTMLFPAPAYFAGFIILVFPIVLSYIENSHEEEHMDATYDYFRASDRLEDAETRGDPPEKIALLKARYDEAEKRYRNSQ